MSACGKEQLLDSKSFPNLQLGGTFCITLDRKGHDVCSEPDPMLYNPFLKRYTNVLTSHYPCSAMSPSHVGLHPYIDYHSNMYQNVHITVHGLCILRSIGMVIDIFIFFSGGSVRMSRVRQGQLKLLLKYYR